MVESVANASLVPGATKPLCEEWMRVGDEMPKHTVRQLCSTYSNAQFCLQSSMWPPWQRAVHTAVCTAGCGRYSKVQFVQSQAVLRAGDSMYVQSSLSSSAWCSMYSSIWYVQHV